MGQQQSIIKQVRAQDDYQAGLHVVKNIDSYKAVLEAMNLRTPGHLLVWYCFTVDVSQKLNIPCDELFRFHKPLFFFTFQQDTELPVFIYVTGIFFYVISSLLYSMWLEENSVNKYDVIFLIKGAQNKCPQLISSPDIIALASICGLWVTVELFSAIRWTSLNMTVKLRYTSGVSVNHKKVSGKLRPRVLLWICQSGINWMNSLLQLI